MEFPPSNEGLKRLIFLCRSVRRLGGADSQNGAPTFHRDFSTTYV